MRPNDPNLISPIAYSRYQEIRPIDHEEEVIICVDHINNLCHYNLRTQVNQPDRYGIDNERVDDESENEESSNEQEETEEEEAEVSTEDSVEPAEFTGLEENSQIPEYMINPERQLFQSPDIQNVQIKHFPKQND